MRYKILTHIDDNIIESYSEDITGLDWTDKRVFELGAQGLYWEIFI
jgi:hypothetical protein